MVLVCRTLVVLCLLATITSTLRVYPHQLAYFNEAAGGPENGYKHLLHSNLDWGQDLYWIAKNSRLHDDNLPVFCALDCLYHPSDIARGIRDSPPNSNLSKLDPGLYYISASLFWGPKGQTRAGNANNFFVNERFIRKLKIYGVPVASRIPSICLIKVSVNERCN